MVTISDKVYIVESRPIENATVLSEPLLYQSFPQLVQLLANAYTPYSYKQYPFLKSSLPKRRGLADELNVLFKDKTNWEWLLDYAFYSYALMGYRRDSLADKFEQLCVMKAFPPNFASESVIFPVEAHRQKLLQESDRYAYFVLSNDTPVVWWPSR